MYTRVYKLKCTEEPKMNRFRIVTTQGLPFAQLMKNYSVRLPGFVSATDDHLDNERWEITTVWESKEKFDEAQKHPYRKMFWNRFEMEAFKHAISLTITDSEGLLYEPFSDLL